MILSSILEDLFQIDVLAGVTAFLDEMMILVSDT
jgi:hypothetical protein